MKTPLRRRLSPWWLGVWMPMGLAVAAMAFGLLAGSSGWGWAAPDILWEIRLPRVLAGFGAGAALALSGALMQLLTRNALADPYVLGISGGAAVGALGAMLLGGLAGMAAWWPAGAAVIASEMGLMVCGALGAAMAAALLFALSWRVLSTAASSSPSAGHDASVSLLLVGVMIGSACSALVSLLMSLAPDAQLRSMVFWLLGDLNGAGQWQAVWLAVLAALAIVWPWARQLDWLARGDAWAARLGVPVARRRRQVLLAASLATGAAVATAGAISFVGL
ncbi:MAG: fecCD transport family protein, partial [Rhizobacter sp.]|nr:fecCD transport family protein [Rhizobacter sp.]